MSHHYIEKQIVINAPAEKVFDYIADISKHGEWGNPSEKLQVAKTSDGPIGQGSTFKSVGQQFGHQNDTIKITEYVPNQRIVYESSGNDGVIRHTFELTPLADGVRVRKFFEPVRTKFPYTVFLPILRGFVLPGALKADLERIKAKLERS